EIQSERSAQSLDRADGEPDRLPEAEYRREFLPTVRRVADFLDELAAVRPDGRGVSATHPVQDQTVFAEPRRIPPNLQRRGKIARSRRDRRGFRFCCRALESARPAWTRVLPAALHLRPGGRVMQIIQIAAAV